MSLITILLIESDINLREEMRDYLVLEGYGVIEVGCLKESQDILKSQIVQAIVIEVGLPDGNGLNALPELRRATNCPLLVLSAWGQLHLRLQALANGADYYLVKPTPLSELSAVLISVLRRSTTSQKMSWRTNAAMQTLTGANGHWMYLTPSEWVFITLVRESAGLVVTRENLVRGLGKDPETYDPRRMDTLIQRIRLNAKQAGLGEMPLRTRHGQGYVWKEQ
jgi:two-component system OmpR family response regulator